MDQEAKQKQAWGQALAEEWMIEMNIIQPELLNKVRMLLMVVYPIKTVEVTCDPSKFTMQFDCQFTFWRSLFRRKKMVKRIHSLLADKFKNYTITVNSL